MDPNGPPCSIGASSYRFQWLDNEGFGRVLAGTVVARRWHVATSSFREKCSQELRDEADSLDRATSPHVLGHLSLARIAIFIICHQCSFSFDPFGAHPTPVWPCFGGKNSLLGRDRNAAARHCGLVARATGRGVCKGISAPRDETPLISGGACYLLDGMHVGKGLLIQK